MIKCKMLIQISEFYMNFTEKRLFLKSGLLYALIQIILYIPIHLTYTGGFENAPEFLTLSVGILSSALSEFAYFSLPIFAAVIFMARSMRTPLRQNTTVPLPRMRRLST